MNTGPPRATASLKKQQKIRKHQVLAEISDFDFLTPNFGPWVPEFLSFDLTFRFLVINSIYFIPFMRKNLQNIMKNKFVRGFPNLFDYFSCVLLCFAMCYYVFAMFLLCFVVFCYVFAMFCYVFAMFCHVLLRFFYVFVMFCHVLLCFCYLLLF